MKNTCKLKIEKFGSQLLDSDDKYSRVYITFQLNFEDSFWVNTEDIENINEIYN